MKTLFRSQNRQQFLVNINLEQEDLKGNLICWLHEHHNDIYWDIEMHEGGEVILDKYADCLDITFRGDNGLFILEQVTQIETL